MLTKASIALLFVVALVSSASVSSGPKVGALEGRAGTGSNHLVAGNRVPGDHLIYRQLVTKSSSWLQIVTKDVVYITPQYETISQVRALDQKTNGNGAFASIVSGGPGNRNVNVHFESQRGHGINFILEIYGR